MENNLVYKPHAGRGRGGITTDTTTLNNSAGRGRGMNRQPDVIPKQSAQVKFAESKVKHLRKGGGEIWSDPTLDDWDTNDHRIFCGNLGNEVTDELLGNAFRQYKSFQRARVIRDKRTGKGKGYGFVSFSDPHDMLKATKEMDRQYVGNRPIKVTRSKWKDREVGSQMSTAERFSMAVVPDESRRLPKFKTIKPVTGGRKCKYYFFNHLVLAKAIPPALAASGVRRGCTRAVPF